MSLSNSNNQTLLELITPSSLGHQLIPTLSCYLQMMVLWLLMIKRSINLLTMESRNGALVVRLVILDATITISWLPAQQVLLLDMELIMDKYSHKIANKYKYLKLILQLSHYQWMTLITKEWLVLLMDLSITWISVRNY